jgi:hypothetical protein
MGSQAIIRRAVADYRANITELTEELSGEALATMLEQIPFGHEPGFVHTLTVDRGVRDFLVRKLRARP